MLRAAAPWRISYDEVGPSHLAAVHQLGYRRGLGGPPMAGDNNQNSLVDQVARSDRTPGGGRYGGALA